jgi:hypothetical protein
MGKTLEEIAPLKSRSEVKIDQSAAHGKGIHLISSGAYVSLNLRQTIRSETRCSD